MQAYHSEGTNIAKVGSLGEPHYLLDSSIPVGRRRLLPGIEIERDSELRVLRERSLLLAARPFHRIELYLALSSH
jgi:hypothetical protein